MKAMCFAAAALLSAFAAGCGSLVGVTCAPGFDAVGESCVRASSPFGIVGPGHSVVLGMDFSAVEPATPEARLLGNAVFMAAADPVRILDYREHAEWNASSVTNVVYLVADEAVARDRTLVATVARSAEDAREQLESGEYDIFLVHDQAAAEEGILAGIGAEWAPAIEGFVEKSGNVVMLATATGSGEMGELISASGVLEITAIHPAEPAEIESASPDALGAGVKGPFTGEQAVASFDVEIVAGQPFTPVLTTLDGAPVAIHRFW